MRGTDATVRVLLAVESGILGDGIAMACASAADLQVVERVPPQHDVFGAAERLRPDVVLIGPSCDGPPTVRRLRDGFPGLRLLLLAGTECPEQLLAAVEAGASGYVSDGAALDELLDGLRAVARGETVVPPGMLGGLLQGLIDRRRLQQDALLRTSGLTRREREVLCLLVRGADTHAIASNLVISRETARTHVQNVLVKLRVHSRLEAAAFVNETGILEDLLRADERAEPDTIAHV